MCIAAENGLILAVLSRLLSAEEAATTGFIAFGRRVRQYCLGKFLPGGEHARRGRRFRFGAAVRCFVIKWGYCAWNSDNIRAIGKTGRRSKMKKIFGHGDFRFWSSSCGRAVEHRTAPEVHILLGANTRTTPEVHPTILNRD